MTKGDQEKLPNNDMIGPYKFFDHQPEAAEKKSLEWHVLNNQNHKTSFHKIHY